MNPSYRGIALLMISFLLINRPVHAESKAVPWLTSREAGLRDAQVNKRPMLVRFGGEYCVWCRRLEQEIEKPAVQKTLKNWTLVVLDVERAAADARALNVESIPALRVLSSAGRLVGSHDGFLAEEKLIEWLNKALETASAAPEEELLATGPPTEIEIQRVVRQLAARDSGIREAAIRRLLPHPAIASEAVVLALKQEKLGLRLAALELLREWQAPLEDLDPWRPETMTAERIARVEEWRATITTNPALSSMAPAALADVRGQLDQMLKSDPITSAAIRERLARYKEALLPEVVIRLKAAASDEDRARLLALRYRLVMEDSLALNSPGLVDRLAAIDVQTRHLAVRELSEQATSSTQPLFLELFADSDSLVRELALVGLRKASGDEGTSVLVKLLDDPEPNVRAAVLKLFAENPWPELKPRLSEFLDKERDTGLLVHAVRCFRKLKNRSSDVLIPLLKHSEWQVRAEALDALSGAWQRFPDSESQAMMNDEDVCEAVAACLNDEDPFVASRSVLGIKNHLTKKVVIEMLKIPQKHASLTNDVIEAVSTATQFKKQVMPVLKDFFASPLSSVRADAISGLGNLAPYEIQKELVASLQDEDQEVRIAGAKTLRSILGNLKPTIRNGRLDIPSSEVNDQSGDEDAAEAMTPANPVIHFSTESAEPAEPAERLGEQIDFDAPVDALDVVDEQADEMSNNPNDHETPQTPAAVGGLFSLVRSFFGGSAPAAPSPVAAPAQATLFRSSTAEQAEVTPEQALEGSQKRDEWLREFKDGKGRPAWLEPVIPPLEKMFASPHAAERIASAVPLMALGRESLVRPQFLELAKTDGEHGPEIVEALSWLPFEDRGPIVAQLVALQNSKEMSSKLVSVLSRLNDVRDADTIWSLCDVPSIDPELLVYIEHGLKPLYLGQNYWNPTPKKKKETYELTKAQLNSPRGWRHILALAFMFDLMPDNERTEQCLQIRTAAKELVDDESLDERIRNDAFQLMLIATDKSEQTEMLVELLKSPDESRKLLALHWLIGINGGLQTLQHSHLSPNVRTQGVGRVQGEQIHPEPPTGLTIENVSPLLSIENAEIRALAGYVLAVSNDASGLAPLLSHWRSMSQDDGWDRLVYRAIAANDDSSQISALRHIYKDMEDYRVSDFYWTIRIMTGPKILEFRKEIRAAKAQYLK